MAQNLQLKDPGQTWSYNPTRALIQNGDTKVCRQSAAAFGTRTAYVPSEALWRRKVDECARAHPARAPFLDAVVRPLLRDDTDARATAAAAAAAAASTTLEL